MWLKQPKAYRTRWDKAVEYCRNLEYRGFSGWRLPSIEELKKIVDRKQKNPALPINHPFSNIQTHVGYWSRTRHKFGPQYVYQMNLYFGQSDYLKKEDKAIPWPVRYAD